MILHGFHEDAELVRGDPAWRAHGPSTARFIARPWAVSGLVCRPTGRGISCSGVAPWPRTCRCLTRIRRRRSGHIPDRRQRARWRSRYG